MKCSDARKWTAGLALDDLDVEIRRDVESHLAECPECRTAAALEASAVKRIQSAPVAETSAARREKAVQAMKSVHVELMERAMLTPRSSRRGWMISIAATLLVAAGAVYMVARPFPGDVLRADKVAVGTMIIRPGQPVVALQPGDVIKLGDIITSPGTTELRGPGGSLLTLHAGASLKLDERNHKSVLFLMSGSMSGEIARTAHTIVDPSNNRIDVTPGGQFEAFVTLVAGHTSPGITGTPAQSSLRVKLGKGAATLEYAGGSRHLKPGDSARVKAGGELESE